MLGRQFQGAEQLLALLQDSAKSEFKNWTDGRQIIDLLEDYPAEQLTAPAARRYIAQTSTAALLHCI